MKRAFLVLVSVGLVGGVAVSSLVRVAADEGALVGGRYLGAGIHLKRPLARIVRYENRPFELEIVRPTATSENLRRELTIRLRCRWDQRRLAATPVEPERLADEALALLSDLDGMFPAAGFAAGLRESLPGLLESLPIHLLHAEASYPEEVFESLLSRARPTGRRVVFVGMDGLDWTLLDRLIAEGRCPTFARLKERGAWGEIASHQPLLSPLIWTTIATGRAPEDHGVLDFVARDPATGKDAPVTNRFRKVHAFWNILSYVGRRVDVVNWWATHPAEPIEGTMVSERVFYQLFGIQPALDDPGNVYPRSALERLAAQSVEAEEIGYDEVRRYAEIDRDDFERSLEAARVADNPYEDRLNHLRKILAVTHGVFNVGRWLLDEGAADLLAIYVEGTDTVGHRFAHFLPPRLAWVEPEDYGRYRNTMARYYELVDFELGELMRQAPPDTTWIVAADHGFFTGQARPRVEPDDFTVGAPQWHRMQGAFLAAGPRIRAGKLAHVDIHDLCRTLLWLLGAPISEQLLGRELLELVDEGWARANPPLYVADYGDLPLTWLTKVQTTAGDASQQARLKELEALGYLASSPDAAPSAEAPAGQAAELVAKPSELYNKAKLARQRGDLEASEAHFRAAIESDPAFAIAMAGLSGVLTARGRHDEALRWLLRAVETGSEQLPATILHDLVQATAAAGRADRTLGVLELLRPRWAETSSFDAATGVALENLGRRREATAAYQAALAKDPADAVATERLLDLAAQGADLPVEEMLDRHFRAVRYDLKRLNDFAVVCLRQQHARWAERALRGVLESDSSNAGVLGNLAVALQMQGRQAESATILERAVAARPDDAGLRFNLGAVFASLGRSEEALGQLYEAERLGLEGPRLLTAQAKVLVRLGREAEAESLLEEGVRRYPHSDEIRALLPAAEAEG